MDLLISGNNICQRATTGLDYLKEHLNIHSQFSQTLQKPFYNKLIHVTKYLKINKASIHREETHARWKSIMQGVVDFIFPTYKEHARESALKQHTAKLALQ